MEVQGCEIFIGFVVSRTMNMIGIQIRIMERLGIIMQNTTPPRMN